MNPNHKWAVVLCNGQYIVQSILRSPNFSMSIAVGDHISRLILPKDLPRFLDMTHALKEHGSHFGNEITVNLDHGHLETMQLGAFVSDQGLYLLLYNHYLMLYDDLISINNEQTNLIRDKMRQAKEAPFYLEQLINLNNDMVNLQRDLYKKNVEIEKLLLYQERLNLQLKSTLELKNQIIGVIGHDLRAPLANIIGFLALTEETLLGSEEHFEMGTMAGHMTSSAKHLLDTLQNLIFWSKSQMSEITCNYELSSISELIESVISFAKIQADKKSIAIHVDHQFHDTIKVDRTLLETVLRNLLSNAIKFTELNSQIWIRVFHHRDGNGSNTLIVEIEDEGQGMTQEQISLVINGMIGFSTYGTSGEKGTGLGLAICKNLVEIHGGQLNLQSTEGKGTCVQVKIPY